MLVVNDIAEMFVPSHPDDLLVNLAESKTVVEGLLAKLPNMFQGTQNVDNAFGVALKAAFEIIVSLIVVSVNFDRNQSVEKLCAS